MSWIRFFIAITPELKALAKLLYERFDGDLALSKAELKRIPDHWSGEAGHRASVDARINAVGSRGEGPKQ